MKKVLSMLLVLLMMCSAISAVAEPANPVPIKVLILPKFEVGELAAIFLAKRSITMKPIVRVAMNMK